MIYDVIILKNNASYSKYAVSMVYICGNCNMGMGGLPDICMPEA